MVRSWARNTDEAQIFGRNGDSGVRLPYDSSTTVDVRSSCTLDGDAAIQATEGPEVDELICVVSGFVFQGLLPGQVSLGHHSGEQHPRDSSHSCGIHCTSTLRTTVFL